MHPALLAAFVVALLGCGSPTPEKVCGRYIELDTKLDPGKKDKRLAQCIERVKQLQADKPEAFKCLVDCMSGASSMEEVNACDRCTKAETK